MADVILSKPGSNVVRVANQQSQQTEVSPSVSGFVGILDAPVEANKLITVTSWNNFKDQCGVVTDIDYMNSHVANAIYSYYLLNKGNSYFVRIEGTGGTKAKIDSKFEAKYEGTWGNKVKVTVTSDSSKSIKVSYEGDIEVFGSKEDLNANSKYVTFIGVGELEVLTETALTGGAISTTISEVNLDTAFDCLTKTDDVTIFSVYLDGAVDTFDKTVGLTDKLKEAEDLYAKKITCICALDKKDSDDALIQDLNTKITEDTQGNMYRLALYYPNVIITKPLGLKNKKITVPATVVEHAVYGYIANRYGIQQSPAGQISSLPNVIGVEEELTDPQVGKFNSHNINCIIPKKNNGIVNWGNRLAIPNQDRKYVGDLLLDDYIETWIKTDTEWATFYNIDDALKIDIVARVEAFLNGLWRKGALKGEEVEQAYFVNCDDATNEEAQEGQLILEVGWAKKKPAEFITTKVIYNALS